MLTLLFGRRRGTVRGRGGRRIAVHGHGVSYQHCVGARIRPRPADTPVSFLPSRGLLTRTVRCAALGAMLVRTARHARALVGRLDEVRRLRPRFQGLRRSDPPPFLFLFLLPRLPLFFPFILPLTFLAATATSKWTSPLSTQFRRPCHKPRAALGRAELAWVVRSASDELPGLA